MSAETKRPKSRCIATKWHTGPHLFGVPSSDADACDAENTFDPFTERDEARAEAATLLSERDAARAERDDLLRALGELRAWCHGDTKPDNDVSRRWCATLAKADALLAAARSRPSSEGGTAK